MKNRRQHPRLILSGLVEIIRRSGENIEAAGFSLGPGGIGVYSHVKMNINEPVILILHFIDEEVGKVSESLNATVTWGQPGKDYYEFGLKFNSLDKNKQAIVLSYMNFENKKSQKF